MYSEQHSILNIRKPGKRRKRERERRMKKQNEERRRRIIKRSKTRRDKIRYTIVSECFGSRQALSMAGFAFIFLAAYLVPIVIFCNRRLNYFNSNLFLILFLCVCFFFAFTIFLYLTISLSVEMMFSLQRTSHTFYMYAVKQKSVSKEARTAQKHTKELFISSDTIKSFIELKQDQRLSFSSCFTFAVASILLYLYIKYKYIVEGGSTLHNFFLLFILLSIRLFFFILFFIFFCSTCVVMLVSLCICTI